MNNCEKLAFATTQIIVQQKDGAVSRGTGFFVKLLVEGKDELLLVTNRHVVENALKTTIIVSLQKENAVRVGNTQTIEILAAKWIGHPDPGIDLCCYVATELRAVSEAKDGVRWFVSPFGCEQIATKAELLEYAPTDEVFAVGYPDGLRDEINNQPFFRRGILAGIPALNYKGQEQFVVDMPIYPGSSGSPVFGIRHGIHAKGDEVLYIPAHEGDAKLLGVVSRTFLHAADGQVDIIPVGAMLAATTTVPNNLGIAIKAYKILDFAKELSNANKTS